LNTEKTSFFGKGENSNEVGPRASLLKKKKARQMLLRRDVRRTVDGNGRRGKGKENVKNLPHVPIRGDPLVNLERLSYEEKTWKGEDKRGREKK